VGALVSWNPCKGPQGRAHVAFLRWSTGKQAAPGPAGPTQRGMHSLGSCVNRRMGFSGGTALHVFFMGSLHKQGSASWKNQTIWPAGPRRGRREPGLETGAKNHGEPLGCGLLAKIARGPWMGPGLVLSSELVCCVKWGCFAPRPRNFRFRFVGGTAPCGKKGGDSTWRSFQRGLVHWTLCPRGQTMLLLALGWCADGCLCSCDRRRQQKRPLAPWGSPAAGVCQALFNGPRKPLITR